MAEHLVASAGDRLVGERQHPGEHVADTVVAGHLSGACEVEATGAVVQQRRVGRAQRGGDGGVALVARRSDRVEADALLAQPARRVIDVAAEQLGLEQLERHRSGQRRPAPDRLFTIAERGRWFERGDVVEQRPLESIQIVDRRIVGRHRVPAPSRTALLAAVAHTSQASRAIGTCSDGRVNANGASSGPFGSPHASSASVRPNQAANLKPWAAPSPDEHLRDVGEAVDDEVAVGGHRVEAGRRARSAEPVADETAHELAKPRFHVGVGIERARVGVDLGSTAVLGRLDGGRVAVHREAVEARVVHPDPHGEPARRERRQVGGREVRDLLAEHDERERMAERCEQAVGPGVGGDDHAAAPHGAGVGDDVDLATDRPDRSHRRVRPQVGTVVSCQSLQDRRCPDRPARCRCPASRSPCTSSSMRSPAANAGHRRRTSQPSIHSYGTPTASRLDVYDDGSIAPPGGKRSMPPVRVMIDSPLSRSTADHASYAPAVSSTYPGVWYERRMIREWSCEAPRTCPSSNCSNPTTSTPRRASQYAAAEPRPPSPITPTADEHGQPSSSPSRTPPSDPTRHPIPIQRPSPRRTTARCRPTRPPSARTCHRSRPATTCRAARSRRSSSPGG